MKRILHPTDFSAASKHAFLRAVELSRTHAAHLTVMHVLPHAQREQVAKQALDAMVTHARQRGVRATAFLTVGIPATAILRAAASTRADLIVLGAQGRRGLARLLFGSTATAVARQARCPVLTLKAPSVDGLARAS